MKYKPIPGHENDIDPKELADPFKNRKYGWILRFTVSAFFGCLVSGFIFLIVVCVISRDLNLADKFWSSKYIHAFWVIPLLWGFLGIFLFETMIESARNLIGSYFGTNR